MQCPNDQATLVMSERSGIEIDYCPECRGVWLDRGELDKIIDRAAPSTPATPTPAPAPGPYAGQAAPAPGYVPRSTSGMAVPRNGYASPGSPGSPGSWDTGRRGYGQPQYGQQPHGYGYGKKRRGNWLSELFD